MSARPKDDSTATDSVAGPPQDPPIQSSTARRRAAGPADYSAVILLADIVNDLEEVRKANENRLRTLTRTDEHGKAVPAEVVAPVTNLTEQISALEHGAILELKRAVLRSPLADFQRETLCLGEKTLGRLIKEIGDPAWNYAADRPRTVRELYAYCGLHVLPAQRPLESQGRGGGDTGTQMNRDSQMALGAGGSSGGGDAHSGTDSHTSGGVAPSRTRGQQANWSTQAKTRLYLVAVPMLKNRKSAYRHVYDQGRAKYVESVHQVECKRCGPSGSPAQPGSPLSDAHKHARAMRLMMKAVLKDLWIAARAHIGLDGHVANGAGGSGGDA